MQALLEVAHASTTPAIPTPGTAPEDQPVHDPSRAQAISFVDETAELKTAYAVQHKHDSVPTPKKRKRPQPSQPSALSREFVLRLKGGGVTVRRIRQLLHIKTLTSLLHSEWTGRTHARTV